MKDHEDEVCYGSSFYRSKSLRFWAERALKYIPDGATLVYRGSSGSALASAMLALVGDEKELSGMYIRKEHETCHGNYESAGYASYDDQTEWYFVDDFISNGNTVVAVVRRMLDIRYKVQTLHLVVHHDRSYCSVLDRRLNDLGVLNIERHFYSIKEGELL